MASDNVLMNIVTAPPAINTTVGFSSANVGEAGRRLAAAARAGDTALVRALLARGAPMAPDWLGAGPLHAAAAAGHADTVAVLLRGGASRDARTKVERTPLHIAACAGHANVAATLLRAGADPHARDLLRMTPLHWAAERAHAPLVALLLRHGADPTAVSKFLKTPLTLAARRPALLQLMEEAISARDAGPEPPLARDAASPASISPEPEEDEESVVTENVSKEQEAGERTADEQPAERAETAGAALLRRHGITLLPPDTGGTVLSALQAGRRVALSAAGRRLLRDSAPAPLPGGVLLTATPVSQPPAPGVKVFTLNSNAKLVALPKEATATAKATVVAAGEGRRTARPVKIVLNRANFTKLAAAADGGGAEGASTGRGVAVMKDGEGVAAGEELAAARAEAAALRREVASLRSRLARYESTSTTQ